MMLKRAAGFTLIETIFSITLFSIIALGVFEAYRAVYVSAAASEQRLLALELASGRLELARSLDFDDLETLDASETVLRSGLSFVLETSVASSSGYKLVEVEVDCGQCRNFPELHLVGRFSSENYE